MNSLVETTTEEKVPTLITKPTKDLLMHETIEVDADFEVNVRDDDNGAGKVPLVCQKTYFESR